MTDVYPEISPYMAQLGLREIDRVKAALGPRYDIPLKHSYSVGQLAEMAAAELAALGVQWGVRTDSTGVRECSEHAAWLAAPDETPVSRLVGEWTVSHPNPPAGGTA